MNIHINAEHAPGIGGAGGALNTAPKAGGGGGIGTATPTVVFESYKKQQ